MLKGAEHRVSEKIKGFTIKETPASTNISVLAVNKETKQLLVVFRRGDPEKSKYLFIGVEDVFLDGIMKAESPGKYVHIHINKMFEFEIITDQLFTLIDETKSSIEK